MADASGLGLCCLPISLCLSFYAVSVYITREGNTSYRLPDNTAAKSWLRLFLVAFCVFYLVIVWVEV